MTTSSLEHVRALIECFVSGSDRSLKLAGEIEAALDEQLGDKEPFASVVLALASYRPGGGPFLYNESDIVPLLKQALEALSPK